MFFITHITKLTEIHNIMFSQQQYKKFIQGVKRFKEHLIKN